MNKLIPIVFSLVLFSSTSFAAPIPLRGVVEGFYGETWSFENRADLMNFCRLHNLNAYIYAPKDDPFHRDKWRVPYPAEKISELKKLVDVAKENGIRFIFAISPGLDLNYTGNKGDEDFKLLLRKIDSMYNIGVRNFAIFFDDLKDNNGKHHEDGKQQAEFLNKLQDKISERFKDVETLITVPTEYFRLDMVNGRGKVNSYTEDFAATLNKKIIVLYTGEGVVCDGITEEDFQAANKIYGRDLGIWWNYPVNDYNVTQGGNRNAKLALGAIEKLPVQNVQAIFFNPMSQYQLSKISLATGADYAKSPQFYNAENSWNKAIDAQFGKVADAMKIFAIHSRHMENNWAKCGAADAPEFETAARNVISSARSGRTLLSADELLNQIDNMEKAADILLENLTPQILAECKPQIEQFKRIAQADRLALKSLQNKSLDPQLKNLREEISKYEKTAILSEKAALKFIDDTINLLDVKKKK
jgi:hyaluronoglucosaminidase